MGATHAILSILTWAVNLRPPLRYPFSIRGWPPDQRWGLRFPDRDQEFAQIPYTRRDSARTTQFSASGEIVTTGTPRSCAAYISSAVPMLAVGT